MKIFIRANLMILAFVQCLWLEGQSSDYNTSILWEIRKPGSPWPSYILGSYHVLDTSRVDFPVDTICSLIRQTRNLCIEVKDMQNESNREKVTPFVLADSGKRLKQELGKAHYRRLKRILKTKGNKIPGIVLNRINPLFISYTIAILKHKDKESPGSFYMDMYLEEYAKARGYRVFGLETFDEQLGMIFPPEITYDSSISILRKTIDKYKNDTLVRRIIDDYINQTLFWDDSTGSEDIDTVSLMVRRNTRMAHRIDSLQNMRSLFIVIGAGHLPYDYGVLNLLAEMGYTVVPKKITLRRK